MSMDERSRESRGGGGGGGSPRDLRSAAMINGANEATGGGGLLVAPVALMRNSVSTGCLVSLCQRQPHPDIPELFLPPTAKGLAPRRITDQRGLVVFHHPAIAVPQEISLDEKTKARVLSKKGRGAKLER